MDYRIDRKAGNCKIEITFTQEEWDAAVDAAYKSNAPKYNVQGFRKGKAPRKVIEKSYGEDVFIKPALESLFLGNYSKILAENKDVKPIEYPSLDFKIVADGAVLTASVDTEPEFTLGKYIGLEVKKTVIEIGDKQVKEYLEKMQEGRARQLAADKGYKIHTGDIAVIDFVGSIDGVEFDGGTAKGHELEIGSRSFIDNFEEQLIGLESGAQKDVYVTFPKDYHVKNLAGKKALFKVNIKNILRKELPQIDDAFAKEVSEFETLAELKEDAVNKLTKQAVVRSKAEDENNLLKAVVEGTKVDVPEKMVQRQLDNIMHDMEYRLAYQGIDLKTYADYLNITEDELRARQREQASVSVKSRIVFEAIMNKEGITATKEEIDAEAQRVAEANGKKLADYTKSKEQMAFIENDVLFAKLLGFLTKKNKFI